MPQRSGTAACPASLWRGSYAISCKFKELTPQADCSTSTPKSTIMFGIYAVPFKLTKPLAK